MRVSVITMVETICPRLHTVTDCHLLLQHKSRFLNYYDRLPNKGARDLKWLTVSWDAIVNSHCLVQALEAVEDAKSFFSWPHGILKGDLDWVLVLLGLV